MIKNNPTFDIIGVLIKDHKNFNTKTIKKEIYEKNPEKKIQPRNWNTSVVWKMNSKIEFVRKKRNDWFQFEEKIKNF